MEKKHFSLEEAQILIDTIRPDALKLIRINRLLSALNTISIEQQDPYKKKVHNIEFNKDFHRLAHHFYFLMEIMHRKGCTVDNINAGFFDIYSDIEDEEIVFCWNIDEDKITSWHTEDENFQSRKPISKIRHLTEKNSFL